MVTLNLGTVTTRKLRGQTYPSYNMLTFDEEDLFINLIETETGNKRQLAYYSVKVENEEYVVCSYKHGSLDES